MFCYESLYSSCVINRSFYQFSSKVRFELFKELSESFELELVFSGMSMISSIKLFFKGVDVVLFLESSLVSSVSI
jgi:hypothetical protein